MKDYLLHPAGELRGYRREDLLPDLLAGLTVATFALPQVMAYATIAELPPHVGLYTMAIAAIIGALWGSSRFLSTGPTNGISLLVLSILLPVATPGSVEYVLAAGLIAVLSGVFLIALALMRLGALVTLASRSVLLGFAAGAAVLIAIGQLRHLLGVEIESTPEIHLVLVALWRQAGETNFACLALGLGTLATLLALRAASRRLPAALIAMVGASVVAALFDLEADGVQVIGEIPRGLPPFSFIEAGKALPELSLVRSLVVGALAVTVLGLAEATAASQGLAREVGDKLDNNQQFFGQGVANIVAGMFSGYPSSGSLTRSAMSRRAGARTRLAGVFTGLGVLAVLLLLAPYAHFIPRAALAGILLFIGYAMIDRRTIARVLHTSKSETVVMGATFAATLTLPLEFAILSGILLALAFFVIQSALPRITQVVPDFTFRHFVQARSRPCCPQVAFINIHGPLFFGAVHHIEQVLEYDLARHPGQIYLVLRMHGVQSCDLSGVEFLESLVRERRALGGDLFLIRPRKPVMEVLRSSGFLGGVLEEDHILTQESAVEYLFDNVLDPVICVYECEHRVFAECQTLSKHTYDVEIPSFRRLPQEHGKLVDPQEFFERGDLATHLIVDVREPSEYSSGHISGSRSIPLRFLAGETSKLPKDQPILLVCRAGRRGTRAHFMLKELGFENAFSLRGGLIAWRAAGLPITPAED